jgi:OPA family sugar phosphate sensor protein UhpC-like MFS transporter
MDNPLRYFAAGVDQPLTDDRALIDRIYRKKRLSVMAAITIGYGIAYTCRLALSVVKKPLIDEGIFTAEELGIIGSGLFYSYAFGKLTNGFLADHSNVKKFFAFGVFFSAVMNLALGVSPAVLGLWVALWAANGWFQGFGAPSGIVALSQWFSNRERGRYYGIWSTAHSLGEGLTFVGVAAMVTVWGWRGGFIGPGLLCIAVAFGIYALMSDRPRTLGLPAVADWKNDHAAAPTEPRERQKSTWSMQLSIFGMPSIWVLGLASATMYVSRYAINSWGILYLQEARGYSLVEAGTLLGINTIAGIGGCLAYGYMSDKLFNARRPPVTLIFGLIEVGSLFVIFFAPPGSLGLLTLAFILYGFGLNGLVTTLGGLFPTDIAPKRVAGAVMGFVGVFSYLAAATQDWVSGYLIERGTTIVDGVRHYDFSSAITLWIGGSVVSLILATTMWNAKAHD